MGRGIVSLALLIALAGAASARQRRGERGGGGRMVIHRPPNMAMYGGRPLGFPRLSPGMRFSQPGFRRLRRPTFSAPANQGQAPRSQRPRTGTSRPPNIEFIKSPSRQATAPKKAVFSPRPRLGPDGKALRGRPVQDVTKSAALVHETLGSPAFVKSVAAITKNPAERDGRYHWHSVGGASVSHWYDRSHGQDWVGVYRGGQSLWTISWHGNFWWHEPQSGRWLSYWRDHWWWHDPQSSPQGGYNVYVDGQYYAWDPGENQVTLVPDLPAETTPNPAPTEPRPASGDETMVVSSRPEFTFSADGSRMVQIEGEELGAYLWDMTRKDAQGNDVMIKYLGQGVTGVSYSDPSRGPLHITLSVQDASGAIQQEVLDAQGNPVTAQTQEQQAPAPPAYGTPGAAGYDAPGGDLPPIDAPQPDGI